MNKVISIFFICCVSFVVCVHAAEKQITMTAQQALHVASDLINRGDFEHANQILVKMPPTDNLPLEIERRFLSAQIAQKSGNYGKAIEIYHALLDSNPGLARVRFELAVCYMKQKKWRRADYHLRLAMAGRDLPDEARGLMNYYRYLIRKNKNWNVWFNFGAAPDSNINNSVGGRECVMTMFGLMCRDLEKAESAVGYNFTLGADYEFKLSEHWRWKNDATIYTNVYDNHDYDDLYLSVSSGPRYVWNRGDVWVGALIARRWYGWEKYNRSVGLRLDTNYDFTRRMSGGVYLRWTKNTYDEYDDLLSGNTYLANMRLIYSFNSNVYLSTRTGITREVARNSIYSYWRPGFSVGLGVELPWGFHVYLSPEFYWTLYDKPRWTVKNSRFTEITERHFTHRYAVSVSNNKLNVWGFVPMVTLSYTRRDSNMWQREFDKAAIEFTMQQKF